MKKFSTLFQGYNISVTAYLIGINNYRMRKIMLITTLITLIEILKLS